jgi:serine/threonine protein kinase
MASKAGKMESSPLIQKLPSPPATYKIDSSAKGNSPRDYPEISLVMPIMDNSLREVKIWNLSTAAKLRIMLKVALGLECLHAHNYLHLDIKADNCLYRGDLESEDSVVCLSDFGLSLPCDDVSIPVTTKLNRITYDHRPPECFTDPTKYSGAADIWSLAIFFLRLTVGDWGPYPYERYNEGLVAKHSKILFTDCWGQIKKHIASYFDDVKSNSLADLLERMFNTEPESRPTISQVVGDKVFDGLREKVFARFGTVCRPKDDPQYSITSYQEKHHRILNRMVEIYLDTYRMESIFTMFMGIDIYFRCLPALEPEVKPEFLEQMMQASMAIAMRFAAFRQNRSLITNPFVEGQILKLLGGKIRRYSSPYESAKNMDELMHFYKTVLTRPEMAKYYFEIKKEKFFSSKGAMTDKFNLTIEEFASRI